MTVKELQQIILDETGLKTSVRKGTGSMKGYVNIWPQYQNGSYPKFPFDFVRGLIEERLSEYDREPKPLYVSTETISVYGMEEITPTVFKKEKKNSELGTRTWGSKNSQLRLDKATTRYAKKLRRGGCARYY